MQILQVFEEKLVSLHKIGGTSAIRKLAFIALACTIFVRRNLKKQQL